MRLLFISFATLFCANAFAQNNVNDLFNTYVIVPAQQRIQILTDELNSVNAQIQNLQDQLANSAPAVPSQESADAGDIYEGPPPVSPLSVQITELQARVTELQNALTYWQTQLTLWLSFNTQQQEQYLLLHTDQISTDTGESITSIITGQNDHLGPIPDPNNPWVVPVFVSTGDAQQDALLIQQWLFQHGLIDSINSVKEIYLYHKISRHENNIHHFKNVGEIRSLLFFFLLLLHLYQLLHLLKILLILKAQVPATNTIPMNTAGSHCQQIYLPADFNILPISGNITKVYFRKFGSRGSQNIY
jgi:hypothetical protein